MKVVGISGSHRADGNTALLVKRALDKCGEAGLETEFVNLADKDVGYCQTCDYCSSNPECSLKDDVNPILETIKTADAIVIGSPTYFGGISGRLSAFFDRTLPLRRNGLALSGKIGAAIAVGGSRNGGQEYTISDIHHFMLIHEMTVVGDKKTAHFGGICVGRNKGGVLEDAEGVQTVDNMAERIIEVLSV